MSVQTKHTAGPWHIQYGGLSDSDEGFGVVSKIEPGIVAECYPPAADAERRKRLLADARLIAAAPELLQAAKRAIVVLRATGESVRPSNVLGALDRAIEKAEGRNQ